MADEKPSSFSPRNRQIVGFNIVFSDEHILDLLDGDISPILEIRAAIHGFGTPNALPTMSAFPRNQALLLARYETYRRAKALNASSLQLKVTVSDHQVTHFEI